MKHALRSLAKSPGFTATVVLTLALGIGMNTAMFSMLNGFLLRPLAYPEADRLFRLDRKTPQQPYEDHSAANFADISLATAEVAELAAFKFWAFTLTEPNQPADVPNAVRVTPNFFRVLGVQPMLGRSFLPDEDTSAKDAVIVISHRYWQSRFNGAADIIGRVVRLDGNPVEIVGVLPPDDDMIRVLAPIGFFRPLVLTEADRARRADSSVSVVGRYREGVTPTLAADRFQVVAHQLAADHPAENAGLVLGLRSLQSTTLTGVGRNITFILLGLSGFVLLIACANLANLLLARALARTREFSIRAALGASRARLIAPLVAECTLLTLLGGGAALLVSAWTTDWLASRFGDPESPVNFSADGRVLAFTLVASACTAFLFGVVPAWWASRVGLNDSLKSGARGSTGTRTQNRFRQILIVAQFALALVLLAGAGFFLRGLQKLMGADLGWKPEAVVSGVVNLASGRYSSAERIINFHTQLRERLLALPGIENASVSFEVPLFNPPARRNYLVQGRPPLPPGQEITAFTNAVSPSYLDTMGMRLLRGRFIDESDRLASAPVVVINDTMARTLFAGETALGQRIALASPGEPQWAEIVGVVADVRPLNMGAPTAAFQVYKPFVQEAWQYVTIAVRAADPAKASTLLEPIRQAVAALDPDQPVLRLMTVPTRIELNFGVWYTINQLLILFGSLGILLAALGIYGVITRLVAQRENEFGIRMALGAQARDILRLVIGSGTRMAIMGAATGMIGAAVLARFLGQALPAFGHGDPLAILAAGVLLLLVALVACLLPARRATKVDPMIALRAE